MGQHPAQESQEENFEEGNDRALQGDHACCLDHGLNTYDGLILQDRFQLLDALGFPWTGKREFLASTKGSTSSSPPPQHRMGPGSVAALLGPMDEGPQPSSSLLSSLASLANEERNRPKSHSEDDPSSGED